MRALRKATVFVVLAAIGLPACMGVALHWGQTDCCTGTSALANTAGCLADCPFEHSSPVDRIISLDDCLICDLLAIAKQVDAIDIPSVAMDRLPVRSCGHVIAPCTENDALAFLARGPPVLRYI